MSNGNVPKRPDELRSEGNDLLATGLGIGAFGMASALLLGAACPLCVVAAPALVGAGLVQRWRSKHASPAAPDAADEQAADADDTVRKPPR